MSVGYVFFLLSGGFSTFHAYNFGPHALTKSSNLSETILYICKRQFTQRTSSLAVSVEVETKDAQNYFNDLTEKILTSVNELAVQIDVFGNHNLDSWDFFNILLVDSVASFKKINPGEKTKNQDFSEHYLVVLKPYTDDDYLHSIEAIFAYCWSYYILNVAIMIEDLTGSVEMYTYFPFTETKCFSTTPVRLKGLDFTDIFPPKVSNFHNCKLVGALWNVPPYLSLNKHSSGLDTFVGIEGHLLRELAQKMNFSLTYITPPNDQQRGLVYKNGTVTGAIKLLQEKTAHLSLGSFRCTLDRSTLLSPSNSFYQTNQVYTVIARTDPWTTFQILTYPFDIYIWAIMLIIIIATVALSMALDKYHPTALYFFFGYRHAGQVMNIFSAWLGSPVVPEPSAAFSRFILSLWLFVTLVLRNSYQALLYDFLQSNLANHLPDTSLELALQEYSLIVNLASFDTFSGVPIIRDGLLKVFVMNITDDGGYPILEATSEKYATATPKDFLSYYALTTKKYGVFHVLKEGIFAQHICIYFTKHSFLTNRFDEVLLNLRSFSLINLWAFQYLSDDFIEMKSSRKNEGIPITINQLVGGFLVSGCLLLVAVCVFVLEVMSRNVRVLRSLFK